MGGGGLGKLGRRAALAAQARAPLAAGAAIMPLPVAPGTGDYGTRCHAVDPSRIAVCGWGGLPGPADPPGVLSRASLRMLRPQGCAAAPKGAAHPAQGGCAGGGQGVGSTGSPQLRGMVTGGV